MTFLGMTGFSADWVEDYAIKVAPLRALITQADSRNLRAPLQWTVYAALAFESIKQELQTAPALGTPDYAKPFLLYVVNRCSGYASAVLAQEACQGRRKQPLAYYSTRLDGVAQGWPPCYQGVAELHYAYNKATLLTMGYPIIIYTHHKIVELVDQGRFVLTTPRTLQYCALITYPDVTIARCTTVNPADNIPFRFEGEPHDCVAEAVAYSNLRPDLEPFPLVDPDMTLFVDGSCYSNHEGNHAGYAVVKQTGLEAFETIKTKAVPHPCLAQKAEFIALTEACTLAAESVANIYIDSAYVHGVCHLFCAVWKQRGFKKTDGPPIQHLTQITDLMAAMMLHSRLGIIKCQAHKKDNLNITKGNRAADEAAKAAHGSTQAVIAPMVTVQPHVTLKYSRDAR